MRVRLHEQDKFVVNNYAKSIKATFSDNLVTHKQALNYASNLLGYRSYNDLTSNFYSFFDLKPMTVAQIIDEVSANAKKHCIGYMEDIKFSITKLLSVSCADQLKHTKAELKKALKGEFSQEAVTILRYYFDKVSLESIEKLAPKGSVDLASLEISNAELKIWVESAGIKLSSVPFFDLYYGENASESDLKPIPIAERTERWNRYIPPIKFKDGNGGCTFVVTSCTNPWDCGMPNELHNEICAADKVLCGRKRVLDKYRWLIITCFDSETKAFLWCSACEGIQGFSQIDGKLKAVPCFIGIELSEELTTTTGHDSPYLPLANLANTSGLIPLKLGCPIEDEDGNGGDWCMQITKVVEKWHMIEDVHISIPFTPHEQKHLFVSEFGKPIFNNLFYKTCDGMYLNDIWWDTMGLDQGDIGGLCLVDIDECPSINEKDIKPNL